MAPRKKGKKKNRCPPDVNRYKLSTDYSILKSLIKEPISEYTLLDLSKYNAQVLRKTLHYYGLLADCYHVCSSKDYRFLNHHRLLSPIPQYNPNGFPNYIISWADQLAQGSLCITWESSKLEIELQELETIQGPSERFLKEINNTHHLIYTLIKENVQNNFSKGLIGFETDLKALFILFDSIWTSFEKELYNLVYKKTLEYYKTIDNLVSIERDLTISEHHYTEDYKHVWSLEELFVKECKNLFDQMHNSHGKDLTDTQDAILCAESILYNQLRISDITTEHAKYVVRNFLKMRTILRTLPIKRLGLCLEKNVFLQVALEHFINSIENLKPFMQFARQLPQPKLSNPLWMCQDFNNKAYEQIGNLIWEQGINPMIQTN